MKITLEVSKITVISWDGPDEIILWTKLPEACYPFGPSQTLAFQAAAGTGEDYVKKHFGCEPDEVISRSKPIKVKSPTSETI